MIRILLAAAVAVGAANGETPPFPHAWTHYRTVDSIDLDFADLKKHGIGVVNTRAASIQEAREALAAARRFGMKYTINLPDVTEQASEVRAAGFQPVYALMIGGVYGGKAVDRHLFRFSAGAHDILIEPPVYNPSLPYTRGSGGSGKPKDTDPIGHYWPDMPAPVKAEIVVPLRAFDGQQHLKIVSATIVPAAPGDAPENDTAAGLPASPEIRGRKLYRLKFDLSGLDGALLDRVGIAVYWPYHGTDQYWLFGKGTVSAAAQETRQALAAIVRRTMSVWSEANGGSFPSDIVLGVRFGDECFYLGGHTHLPSDAVNFPLWDFSAAGVHAYQKLAGAIEYPRTWGYPEIYGPDAYGWWMYALHKSAAELVRVAREEVRKIGPNVLLYRNTTRGGVFSMSNDRDGTGPELLTRELDIAHLDPYPVSGTGYSNVIPRDMSYHAGLARRYRKPLIPWMQAHTYAIGKDVLQHVTPEHVNRMGAEHLRHGIDAVVWLGYCPDCTFPKVVPESWERAAAFHKQLDKLPPKPRAEMAVLRGYSPWAQTGLAKGLIRNPVDWHLQQFLEVWAVQESKPYDVFELPPVMSAAERAALRRELKAYRHIVSTVPWDGAWLIGGDLQQKTADSKSAPAVRARYEKLLKARGWLAPH